jgi:predicted tellurium resistance membrane protein TerC
MEIMGLSLADFFAQLFGIVLIDLVLGGDNAIVIGMA